MELLKVSDYIAEFLEKKEMKHVFGIIGAGNAHIFDAISKRGYTEIICVHHEQAAVMAATTYFRMTGIISAALLTTGAGSTNGITGVVSAWMDSMPIIVISGNENSKYTTPENELRIWGVQGYNSTEMVKDVSKLAERVMQADRIQEVLNRAYMIAKAPRQGPVWIDIPMNVQSTVVSIESLKPIPDIHVQNLTATNSTVFDYSVGIEKTISLINKAKRPVLWLGNGIRAANASDLVIPLVDQLAIPTLVSWQACDILDSNHPLCFGRAGVYGQRAANFVLQNCDTLICIGTRLAIPQIGYDLSEFARDAQIVMVDIDEKELLKLGEKINVPILSDAGQFIKQLINHHQTKLNIQGWISQCNLYKHNYPVVGKEHDDITDASGTTYMNSYRFMQKLEKHFHPDQIVTTDMGTALLSGHQVLKFKNGQRMLTSTGLGEMGFGLPAAIGAAIATNREVLCLNCDGGMMLNLQELQTVVHHRLPIKIIIFNNDGYLMIKHTQKALFNGRYAGSDKKSGVTCPNFSKLAVAFDIPTYQIRSWENFDYIIGVVQAERGPVICEVFTHPEQPFTPKLSVVSQSDGSLVSPPLEDLSPLLTREEMKENMIIGLHPKSLNF